MSKKHEKLPYQHNGDINNHLQLDRITGCYITIESTRTFYSNKTFCSIAKNHWLPNRRKLQGRSY